MPKKITIFEDGTKKITELSAFSVDKNDIVEYAFSDDNGYYYLDSAEKQSADQYLLILKIGFLARKRLLNDFLLLSVRNEALKEIKNATNDISIQKYLTKQIESSFNNLTISFEDIVRELDAYTIDVVMEMFEDVTDEAEENPEYIDFELIENYRRYVGKRSGEKEYRLYTEGIMEDDTYLQDNFDDYQADISLLNEMQNEEINYQESEHKKEHRFLKGIGKFAQKTVGLTIGTLLHMSDDEITEIQNADLVGMFTGIMEGASNRNEELTKRYEKKEKIYNEKSKALLEEKRKAFRKRGLDYDILYKNNSTYKVNKDIYLRSKNINSKEEYNRIVSEINVEVTEAMKKRGY